MKGEFLQKHFWKLAIIGSFLVVSALIFAFYVSVVYPSHKNLAAAEKMRAAGYEVEVDWRDGSDWWDRFAKYFPDAWNKRLTTVNMPPGKADAGLVSLSGLNDLRYLGLAAPSNDLHFETLGPQEGVFDLHLQGSGFTNRSLSHLLEVSENTLPGRMLLLLESTDITDQGFEKYLTDQAGQLSWLHLRGEVNLKPVLPLIASESERLKLDLGLENMDLDARDLAHFKNRHLKMLDIRQEHFDLNDLPEMECDALWLQDSDNFTKDELAPLARLKIKDLYIVKNGLTDADVKFLTDAGVHVGWLQ